MDIEGSTTTGVVRWIVRRLRRTFASFARARARRSALRALYRMDDRLLADIGLGREQLPEFVDGLSGRGSVSAVPRSQPLTEVAGPRPVAGANESYRSAA